MDERDNLITANLGLVHSCALRFKGRGIEYEDLYQVGCIGLIKAADGFDKTRGLAFSTYAVPTILGEIKRLFRDTGAVKVSRSLKETALKVLNEKQRLEKLNVAEVGVNTLAEKMGLDASEVAQALCVLQPTVSLTANDEKEKQTDIPIESEEETVDNKLYVKQLMNCLQKNEQEIINLRYFKYKTQSETAKILSMTQVQVSRSEKKILEKLRNSEN